jgi:hypothetical protein
MKGGEYVTKKIWLCLVVVSTLAFFTGITAYACGNNCKGGGKNYCSLAVEGAKVETGTIPNGIAVMITSDDPEVVKQVQERTANCKCEKKKNITCEVTNVANGVTILIISDDPDVVKEIQEHQADCLKNCQKKCAGKMSGCCKHGTK